MIFDQESFNNFVLDNNVIGFFSEAIKLKSGRMSHWYVNWRTVAEDVALTDVVSNFLLNFISDRDLKVDTIYGVPEGATKLAVISQYKLGTQQPHYAGSHVLSMGRGKPKEHGAPKDRYFLGMPKGKVLVLEDVTTTGGSLLETIDQLQEADVDVVAAVGLTNRLALNNDRMSVKELVDKKGIPYISLSDAQQLLPLAYKELQPSEEVADFVEKEFEEYGVMPLKLR